MNSPRKTFSTVLIFIGIALPLIALAVPPLVPCTSPDSLGGTACTLCQGVTLAQNLINYAILLAFPIATLLFAYAGFKYFTSGANPATLTQTHQIFKATAIGFIFVIGGYIIVDLFLHTVLVNPNAGIFQESSWFTVGQCTGIRPTTGTVQQWLGGLFSTNPTITAGPGNVPGGSGPTGTCTISCDQGQLCNPTPDGGACVSPSAGEGCPSGTFADYESGTCTTSCSNGQQYNWTTGNCDSTTNCLDSSATCTATNGVNNTGQCTAACGQGQLCNPSNNSCVGGDAGGGCSSGTWADFETGRCSTACSAGQQYDWSTGYCTDPSACPSGDICTATNGNTASANASCAASYAVNNHYASSQELCLQNVRLDLANCGFSAAKGGFGQNGAGLMQATGYQAQWTGSTNGAPTNANYTPQPGDVANLQYSDSSGQHSHWEIYASNGQWISDFAQQSFNAYASRPTVSYTIYRHP